MPSAPSRDELLLQEHYASDPWKMLVCCILLNQTSRKQVDGVLDELFGAYPNAGHMASATPVLEEYIQPLGLWRRRAQTLPQFSEWWLAHADRPALTGHMHMMDPPGVGEYARDSWILFVEGPTPENVSIALGDEGWPADKELARWFAGVREYGSSSGDTAGAVAMAWQWQLDHPGGYISEEEHEAMALHVSENEKT